MPLAVTVHKLLEVSSVSEGRDAFASGDDSMTSTSSAASGRGWGFRRNADNPLACNGACAFTVMVPTRSV